MISLSLLLFLIIDPFGNIVALNAMLSDFSPAKRRAVILRESAIATVILLAAAFLGAGLLELLALENYSLQLAGGIVLFLIALGMLFPSRRMIEDDLTEAPLIVPIAMPLMAGPSAISMVILFSKTHSAFFVSSAVLIASAASTILLVISPTIFSFLGQRGANALERLMGMLLIMISVQMILDGIDAYLHSMN